MNPNIPNIPNVQDRHPLRAVRVQTKCQAVLYHYPDYEFLPQWSSAGIRLMPKY